VEVVASLSQGRTAAAQCGLFTYKSVPVIFEPPCTLSNPSRPWEMHDVVIMHFLHLLYKRRQNISGFSPHFSCMKDGRLRLCVKA